MTFDAAKNVIGGIPVTVCEMDIDYCSLTYGVAPCTASGAPGTECYNTRATCQDVPNYTKIIKIYRFCDHINDLPVGIDMIPAVESQPVFTPGKLTPGKGLGYRSTVNIRVRDFPYHDRGIDKYVATRFYDAYEQGTYWGKFIARNPYTQGRIIRFRTGYVTEPWDWANFEDRVYIIDSIKGPDNKGFVTITAKDVITLANDRKSKCPIASTGVLLANITNSASSLTLSPSGIGNTEYDASGTLRVGSEEMTFTRSGDTVTLTARGVNGSTADSHTANDTVQQAKVYTNANVIDIVDDLLNNYVDGFDASSWIPYDQGISGPSTGTNDEWDDEKSLYLSSTDINRTISKPAGVSQLIGELTEQFLFNISWHEINQKVSIKAIAPPKGNVAVTQLNEDSNILKNSFVSKIDERQRVSQVWIHHTKLDNTEGDEAKNYRYLYIYLDTDQENVDLYGTKQVKVIYANWMSSAAQASQLGGRILARFYQGPRIIKYSLDAKDSGEMPGDLVDVTSRHIQSPDGASDITRFEVLSVREAVTGHKFEYEALASSYVGLYGFIGPNSLGDYTGETSANRQAYGFIAPDSGIFADGTDAYKII